MLDQVHGGVVLGVGEDVGIVAGVHWVREAHREEEAEDYFEYRSEALRRYLRTQGLEGRTRQKPVEEDREVLPQYEEDGWRERGGEDAPRERGGGPSQLKRITRVFHINQQFQQFDLGKYSKTTIKPAEAG